RLVNRRRKSPSSAVTRIIRPIQKKRHASMSAFTVRTTTALPELPCEQNANGDDTAETDGDRAHEAVRGRLAFRWRGSRITIAFDLVDTAHDEERRDDRQ